MTSSTPGVPQDRSLAESLSQWETDGYAGQFVVREFGELECETCCNRVPAREMGWDGVDRLEGASDPDDMLLVAAGRCPRCGVSGTVVLTYGPRGSVDEAEG